MAVSREDRSVMESFKQVLVERGVPIRSVILFGSRARGDHDEDSDFDVMVITDRVDPEIRESVSHAAWEIDFERGTLICPIIVTQHDLEQTPFRSSLLMRAVNDEGVLV